MQLWCVVGTVKKQAHSSLRESLTRFRRGSVTRDAPLAPPPRHPFFPSYLARPGSQPATLKKGLLPSFPPSSTPFHSISALLSLGCHPHPPSLLPLPLHCYSLTRPRRPNPPTDRPADRRPSGKSRGHRRLSRGGRFIIHGILIWRHP